MPLSTELPHRFQSFLKDKPGFALQIHLRPGLQAPAQHRDDAKFPAATYTLEAKHCTK